MKNLIIFSITFINSFQGLSKEKDKRVSNSLWVYSITNSQWSCIYKNDNQAYKYWCKTPATEPCPRFLSIKKFISNY